MDCVEFLLGSSVLQVTGGLYAGT